MKKAPSLTKLGSGIIEAADKICEACQIRDGAIADSKLYKEQKKTGIPLRIPNCMMGGELSKDGKKLYCKDPKKAAQWRDVKKFCRVVRNGANCQYLKWITIEVKPEIDGQNL